MLATRSPLPAPAHMSRQSPKDETLARSISGMKLSGATAATAKKFNNGENTANQRILTKVTHSPSLTKPRSVAASTSSSVTATPILTARKRSPPQLPAALGQVSAPVTPLKSATAASPAPAMMVPPSPIASASPNVRRLKLTIGGSDTPPTIASLPSPVKRALTKKFPSTSSGEAGGKKLLFSPNYLEKNKQRGMVAGRKPAARTAGTSATGKARTAPITATVVTVKPQPAPVTAPPAVDDEDAFDPLVFIAHLPPLFSLPRAHLPRMPAKAPGHPRVTLALDLDETLVHCSISPIDKYELTFKVNFNSMDYTVYVRIRPGLEEFLSAVSSMFEVVVFTASQQVYADKLLDIIDPSHRYIRHRVFRDSCVVVDGNFLKDLNVLNRDLRHCCLVDNSIQAFGFQVNNGIPIESWFDDEHDRELEKLIPLLSKLQHCQDVRPIIKDAFRLQELIDRIH